jgi:threonine dehydrogenase-like Zn-dependent dehydrogenase
VGLGGIAASARRGARVITVDVDEWKLELARRAGATETVSSSAGDPRVALADLTGGDGPLVVIEAAGLAETYRLAFEAVAFAGRVVCLGQAAKEAFETCEVSLADTGAALSEGRADIHITIPDALRTGHQAHFAEVTGRFLEYLRQPASLPAWEKANMLAKYALTTRGASRSGKAP